MQILKWLFVKNTNFKAKSWPEIWLQTRIKAITILKTKQSMVNVASYLRATLISRTSFPVIILSKPISVLTGLGWQIFKKHLTRGYQSCDILKLMMLEMV